jgi:hypothetical protein
MNNKRTSISNRPKRAWILVGLVFALLLTLSFWSSLAPVNAVQHEGVEPEQVEIILSYQVMTGTLNLTYTVYMPFVSRMPTPTPSPTPDAIYRDDFSNTASGWITGSGGNCEYRYVGGAYQITITEDNGHTCVAFNPLIPKAIDGDFRVRVRRLGGETRKTRYGFFFAAGSDAVNNRWFLEVTPYQEDCDGNDRGFYWISALEDGDSEYFAYRCTTDINTGSDQWNDLRVVRNGGNVDVYVNGNFKDDYDRDVLDDEGFFNLVVVGVENLSDSRPTTIEFDDVEIRGLD